MAVHRRRGDRLSPSLAWAEFAAGAPELAGAGERMFRAFTVGYLASLDESGAPRIHPISLTLTDGGLFVFVIANSRRAGDLQRDPRFALHAFPHSPTDEAWDDEEFEVEGTAVPITDPARRTAIAAVHTDTAGPDDPLFELRVGRAHWKSRLAGRQRITRWAATAGSLPQPKR